MVPRLVVHDSARFDGYPLRTGQAKDRKEEEKNALVITRLRDDQKEACRYLQPCRGTDRAATRSIVQAPVARNPNRASSNSRSSNNANMLVRGSLLWHETRTHMVGGGEGRNGGIAGWGGDGVVCRRYRVKFSAEYKGPSRAWPKAGFTALLVNLAVCAYIFKTHFDPPGWKGSHCRRQFSIFSPSAPSLPLCPRYLPFPRCFLPLPFHAAGPKPRVRRIRCCWTLENFSRELALPPFPFEERDANSSPGFPPFAPLGDDASDAAQLNF